MIVSKLPPTMPMIEPGGGMTTRVPLLRGIADRDHRNVLRLCILSVDRRLRRHYGVHEYSLSAGNLLRISLRNAERQVLLADGTEIRPGDGVIDLHLWNERIPALGSARAGLRWGCRTKRRIAHSLAVLADHVEATPALRPCKAVRAEAVFLTGRHAATLSRIAEGFGFEVGSSPSPADPGHTLLAFALAWACHPGDPILRPLRATHHHFWMSRRTLRARHLDTTAGTPTAFASRRPERGGSGP